MTTIQTDFLRFPVPTRLVASSVAAVAHTAMRRLTDLRLSLSIGAELLWFASAVIVGLALAGVLSGLIGAVPMHFEPDLLIL